MAFSKETMTLAQQVMASDKTSAKTKDLAFQLIQKQQHPESREGRELSPFIEAAREQEQTEGKAQALAEESAEREANTQTPETGLGRFGLGLKQATLGTVASLHGTAARMLESVDPAQAQAANLTADELRERAELINIPKAEGAMQAVGDMVAQALPFTIGSIASTMAGGPAAGFSFVFASEGDNAAQETLDNGGSQAEADTDRIVVGTINAVWEMYGLGKMFKGAKLSGKAIKELFKAVRKKSMKKILAAGGKMTKQLLEVSITESFTEAMQQLTSISAPRVREAVQNKEKNDFMPLFQKPDSFNRALQFGLAGPTLRFNLTDEGKNATKEVGQAALGGAIVGPVFAGAGGVGQSVGQSLLSSFSKENSSTEIAGEPMQEKAVREAQAATAPGEMQTEKKLPKPTNKAVDNKIPAVTNPTNSSTIDRRIETKNSEVQAVKAEGQALDATIPPTDVAVARIVDKANKNTEKQTQLDKDWRSRRQIIAKLQKDGTISDREYRKLLYETTQKNSTTAMTITEMDNVVNALNSRNTVQYLQTEPTRLNMNEAEVREIAKSADTMKNGNDFWRNTLENRTTPLPKDPFARKKILNNMKLSVISQSKFQAKQKASTSQNLLTNLRANAGMKLSEWGGDFRAFKGFFSDVGRQTGRAFVGRFMNLIDARGIATQNSKQAASNVLSLNGMKKTPRFSIFNRGSMNRINEALYFANPTKTENLTKAEKKANAIIENFTPAEKKHYDTVRDFFHSDPTRPNTGPNAVRLRSFQWKTWNRAYNTYTPQIAEAKKENEVLGTELDAINAQLDLKKSNATQVKVAEVILRGATSKTEIDKAERALRQAKSKIHPKIAEAGNKIETLEEQLQVVDAKMLDITHNTPLEEGDRISVPDGTKTKSILAVKHELEGGTTAIRFGGKKLSSSTEENAVALRMRDGTVVYSTDWGHHVSGVTAIEDGTHSTLSSDNIVEAGFVMGGMWSKTYDFSGEGANPVTTKAEQKATDKKLASLSKTANKVEINEDSASVVKRNLPQQDPEVMALLIRERQQLVRDINQSTKDFDSLEVDIKGVDKATTKKINAAQKTIVSNDKSIKNWQGQIKKATPLQGADGKGKLTPTDVLLQGKEALDEGRSYDWLRQQTFGTRDIYFVNEDSFTQWYDATVDSMKPGELDKQIGQANATMNDKATRSRVAEGSPMLNRNPYKVAQTRLDKMSLLDEMFDPLYDMSSEVETVWDTGMTEAQKKAYKKWMDNLTGKYDDAGTAVQWTQGLQKQFWRSYGWQLQKLAKFGARNVGQLLTSIGQVNGREFVKHITVAIPAFTAQRVRTELSQKQQLTQADKTEMLDAQKALKESVIKSQEKAEDIIDPWLYEDWSMFAPSEVSQKIAIYDLLTQQEASKHGMDNSLVDFLPRFLGYSDTANRFATWVPLHSVAYSAVRKFSSGKMQMKQLWHKLEMDIMEGEEQEMLMDLLDKGQHRAFIRQYANIKTKKIHFAYDLSERTPMEQHASGRLLSGVITWPRSAFENYVRTIKAGVDGVAVGDYGKAKNASVGVIKYLGAFYLLGILSEEYGKDPWYGILRSISPTSWIGSPQLEVLMDIGETLTRLEFWNGDQNALPSQNKTDQAISAVVDTVGLVGLPAAYGLMESWKSQFEADNNVKGVKSVNLIQSLWKGKSEAFLGSKPAYRTQDENFMKLMFDEEKQETRNKKRIRGL